MSEIDWEAAREVTAAELSPEMLAQAAELLGITPEELLDDPRHECEEDEGSGLA
jgi:hypothetical protein